MRWKHKGSCSPGSGGRWAQDAERARFERLIAERERLVLRTALRLLGHVEEARDAAQEVFLKLYRNLGRMEPGRDLRPWLYRVTVNVCHDLRHGGHEELDENQAADKPDPEAAAGLTEQRRLIALGLRRLPEKERAAVVLQDIEGLTIREVAEILGSSGSHSPVPNCIRAVEVARNCWQKVWLGESLVRRTP